jgi:hypothetical protein
MLQLAPKPATVPAIPAALAHSILRRDIKRALVAATMALAVGVTALGTLGVLAVAVAGIGLTMFPLPPSVVWIMVAVASVVSVALTLWLSYAVWTYEWCEEEVS